MKLRMHFLSLFVLFTTGVLAQEYNLHGNGKVDNHHHRHELKNFKKSFSSGKKIVFKVERMAFEIEGHSGSEVLFETHDYHAPPERAKGLRPLYNPASDNTGLGLHVEVASGVMNVESACNYHMHFKVKVPSGVAIHIEEDGWDGGGFDLKNVKGEIEIMAKGADITIDGAQGPIVANTTSGDITVVFDKLNQAKPTSISNTSGFIDVSLPSNVNADLIMDSISGEIYTDMEIKFDGEQKKGLKPLSRNKIKGKLNNGGVEISLKAISHDIYLRKK